MEAVPIVQWSQCQWTDLLMWLRSHMSSLHSSSLAGRVLMISLIGLESIVNACLLHIVIVIVVVNPKIGSVSESREYVNVHVWELKVFTPEISYIPSLMELEYLSHFVLQHLPAIWIYPNNSSVIKPQTPVVPISSSFFAKDGFLQLPTSSSMQERSHNPNISPL